MKRFWSRRNFSVSRVLALFGGLALFALLTFNPAASFAQTDDPAEVAQFVYQKLPNLPIENQYLRADTKKRAVQSTLVSRLVQYHTSVKGRPPLYRLDWKITLADYLGVNDYLQLETYPGNSYLKTNPMERDRQLVQALTLSQRNALVQALVDAFSGQKSEATGKPTPQSAQPQGSPASQSAPPVLPSRRSSDLLIGPAQPSPQPSGEAQFLRP